MSDVARIAGVSPMTVSRTLRGDLAVSAATREHVLRVAEEIGYVPSSNAAALSSRRSGLVAVTLPSVNNANFADTLRTLTERLESANLQVLFGYTDYSKENEERVVATLLRRRPQAIVLTGGAHTPRTSHYLRAAGIPVVEMWDQRDEPIEHIVGFSNAEAAARMVQHLHTKGYRRMGFLGVDTARDIRGGDRLRGFRRMLLELELEAHRVVRLGVPPMDMAQGARAMDVMLDNWPDVEAVLCVSDLSAMGALHACRKRGLDVPSDIAVAGFGNFDLAAYTMPPLTTIDVDTAGIGRRVGDVVLDAIGAKGDRIPARRLTTDIRIVERESA